MCLQRNPFLTVHKYLFFWIGDFIYDYPKQSSWIATSICILLSLGLYKVNFKDSFRNGYFLSDSRSVKEHKAFLQFYNYSTMPYVMALLGECNELGCSLLEKEYLMEMNNEIMRGLQTVLPPHDFYESSSRTLGSYLIYSSTAHFMLLQKYTKSSNRSEVILNYPYLIAGSEHVSLQNIIYGATKGRIFALRFLMAFNASNSVVLNAVKAAELQWYQKLKARINPRVKLYLLGDEIVDYEIRKASRSTVWYFISGALLMIAVVYRIIWQYEQGRKVNVFLTFMTIFCPALAGAAAFGFCSFLGIPINSAMMITPFLVFGIGVDDAFLLMHSWFYSQSIASVRFCLMYVTTGPSITLSSLTNVAAFLIGHLMSPSADIAQFCLCTAIAFALCWLLEVFVFAPQLQIRCPGKVPPNNCDGFHVPKQYFIKYSSFLYKCSCYHVGMILAFCALITSCIFVVMNMKETFVPEKTFDGNSFLAKSIASLNKIYSDHLTVTVIAENLPASAKVLHDEIAQIKSFPYLCDNYTIWLELYEQLYKPKSADIQKYFSNLPNFVKQYPDIYLHIIYDTNSNGSQLLKKISFELCLQGFELWRDRAIVANRLREMLPKGYSMFFYDSHIFDLILSIKSTMLKAVVLTVLVMVVICTFFLPTIKIAICIVLSMLSISTFVIGSHCVWGADLDVVLMVNIIMAAGFTVDYVSHVSYSLFLEGQSIKMDPKDRMAKTLRAICGPTAQAAMTTIICVTPLLIHKVYMYIIFARTVLLCSIFGFLHAIFVMPFLVSLIEMVIPSCSEERNSKLDTVALDTFLTNNSTVPATGDIVNNDDISTSNADKSHCRVSKV